MHEFTEMIDLIAARVGGQALLASDEFFAPKENLIQSGRGLFIPDKYTEFGKWMDGWETRRKRVPGYDWCVLRLGLPGRIHGIDVDTNHFLGNFPGHCSVEACRFESTDRTSNNENEAFLSALSRGLLTWTPIVPISELKGGSPNLFAVCDANRFTHVRLNIYPDGGVARFRVFGEVQPDWTQVDLTVPIDLAAVEHGGVALLCNDMFFSHRNNLIMPGRALNMGDGWETRRKRGPGNDWIIVQLGLPGQVQRIEVDTNHFKGNFPESCSIEGALLPNVPTSFLTSRSIDWRQILARTSLSAHHRHFFESHQLAECGPYTHIRLNIFPDGGVSRLRIWSLPQTEAEV